MATSEFKYRDKPSKKCPYLLVTTPKPHYAGFMYKAAEQVLINRFGLKNVPRGAFWKMTLTSTEMTDAFSKFKAPWGLFKVLGVLKKHGHSEESILLMLRYKNIRFPTIKHIGSYKFWCQQETERIKKRNELNATKTDVELEDEPVIEIEKKKDDDILDWLDS